MIFNGRILDILNETEGVTKTKGEPYKTIEFVVEEIIGAHPNKACFSIFSITSDQYGNKVDKFKKDCAIGTEVEVKFNIQASFWQPTSRYFTKLSVWKVEAVNMSGAASAASSSPVDIPAEADDSGLPF